MSFGCAACIPEIPVQLSKLGLKTTDRLVDESHFGVSIRQCPKCGQQFVSVFTERIDWVNGEDPQCSTLLPVTEEEAARKDLAEFSALGWERKFLRDDWPPSGPRCLEYGTGQLVGPHD